MSLISEALKKARQEAARQDSLRQGLPYAVGAVDSPRRNPLLPVVAGLGAGCLLGGILFATAWIGGWGPFAKPVPAAAPTQVAQAAPPAAPVFSAPPSSSPPAVEVREETPIAPVAPSQPQATPPPAPPPGVEPQPTPQSAEPVPEAPAPEPEVAAPSPAAEPIATPPVQEAPAVPVDSGPATPPLPPPASGLEEGKVYAGEVPLPGGGSLKLNGIAYSQERPVVVLDGRVMGTGETIQGFTVVGIEAGRVKLEGHGATVFVAPN